MTRCKGVLRLLTATFVAFTAGSTTYAQTPTHADRAPVIDGSDADAVWRAASVINGFRVFDPTEDGEPSMRTEARIAYDARNIYIFVRAFDPHPDSIVSLLSRRDVRTASDQLKVMIDSYYDRRSGYEFAVNPAGVKRDYYTYDDASEDISWDAVWDVATRIDSLGWTAEFQIPLSQLRYTAADANTMGFMIMRDIARTNERQSWPVYRRSRPGIASQFARIDGLSGVSSPRRIELLPYAVTRNKTSNDGRAQEAALGGDARIGIGSNLTLTAAVNPDFGQVEADPAVINLTAFETSFAELRPFFVEGANAFGRNQTLFYSRRIGRPPQLGGLAPVGEEIPSATPISAAAKLTGRTNGYTIGALSAYTAAQHAGTVQIEPSTFYSLARVSKDLRGGASGYYVMATALNRDLDASSSTFLRERAYAGAFEARHRFARNTYEARGGVLASHVDGSASAIARTQRSAVHYYHRPDSPLDYDPTATSLNGTYWNASIAKVAGALQGSAGYQNITPGFETNDMGFLTRADYQTTTAVATLTSRRPRAFWSNAQAGLVAAFNFTADGMPTDNFVQVQGYTQFKNTANVSVTAWSDYVTPAYCDRCARGGPALRLSPDYNVLINLQADTRKKVVPYFAAIYTVADNGRSYLWRVRPLVAVRNGARISWEFASRYQKNQDNTQWVTNAGLIGSDTTHYVFGHLNQDLLSFSARLNYTLTPTLSFQYYAEPFVTTGHYSNLRELSATPRANDYDARFRPTSQRPNADFNVKQFNSNAVLRWEYKPGSTLYVVWQQGRDQSDRDIGAFDAVHDYRNLFRTRPDNTFLIKASYWLNL